MAGEVTGCQLAWTLGLPTNCLQHGYLSYQQWGLSHPLILHAVGGLWACDLIIPQRHTPISRFLSILCWRHPSLIGSLPLLICLIVVCFCLCLLHQFLFHQVQFPSAPNIHPMKETETKKMRMKWAEYGVQSGRQEGGLLLSKL